MEKLDITHDERRIIIAHLITDLSNSLSCLVPALPGYGVATGQDKINKKIDRIRYHVNNLER